MKDPFQHNDCSTLILQDWLRRDASLTAGITMRKGGVGKPPFETMNLGLHVNDEEDTVLANRRKLADITGFPLDSWVAGEQIHGTDIAIVTSSDKGKGAITTADSLEGCDGLITNQPGILCTAFFADCVPLYFFDPLTGWLGIAHAGWRGTVKGMAAEMVKKLRDQGVALNRLLAAIGPSIGAEVYEVDNYVIEQIPAGLADRVVTWKENSSFLDLKKLNQEILQQAGIPSENISRTSLCTFSEEDKFFSHRRDKGTTGRMLGFIGYQT
ncbi:peptidoglycan editing factor PgeF [Sediminibacillus albus]|uniref:Purine nucleoside phosphorylase n=1 Tax=Sediminibacillus albus TaxID=407036 RepID=A0A1G8W6N3_9BACI|nr:peptidoglycan editing factor PgeF [Sediminibacillus albus]SDJ73939.1 conserved hypothetical protein [Sediminibacillus albus]